jgi:ferredoxin
MTTHDDVVKAGDAQTCFKCHKETYCSYCHVRLIR